MSAWRTPVKNLPLSKPPEFPDKLARPLRALDDLGPAGHQLAKPKTLRGYQFFEKTSCRGLLVAAARAREQGIRRRFGFKGDLALKNALHS